MFISDADGFFNNIIDNNEISGNKNQGIFLGGYQGTGSPVISGNNEITNNIIKNDKHIGVQLANADYNLIKYNEIYGCENTGETGQDSINVHPMIINSLIIESMIMIY